MKRIKDIEDKSKEQLKASNKKRTQKIKEVTCVVEKSLSLEAKELIEEIKNHTKRW